MTDNSPRYWVNVTWTSGNITSYKMTPEEYNGFRTQLNISLKANSMFIVRCSWEKNQVFINPSHVCQVIVDSNNPINEENHDSI